LAPVADWKLKDEDAVGAVAEGIAAADEDVEGAPAVEINEKGAEDAVDVATVAEGVPVAAVANEKVDVEDEEAAGVDALTVGAKANEAGVADVCTDVVVVGPEFEAAKVPAVVVDAADDDDDDNDADG
jgi:hypothetical protein